MRAYYSSRWHEDHSPRATAPQQPLRHHFIVDGARRTSSSSISRRVSLFLSAGFSLSANLSVEILSLLLSLSALSAFLSDPLSRPLCVVLRRSITFYSTLAQSTGLNYDRVSACLHLGRPPRLSTLPQLYQRALQLATIASKIVLVYKYDI